MEMQLLFFLRFRKQWNWVEEMVEDGPRVREWS